MSKISLRGNKAFPYPYRIPPNRDCMRAVLAAGRLLPAMIAVATLAVLVNFIELLCTAGFPAIYTAILAQQNLHPLAYYAYLALYIVGYIAR